MREYNPLARLNFVACTVGLLLQLTKLIAQTIKAKKYRVNSLLLDTFLCLNLHDVSVSTEEDGATKRKDKSVMSKKEKKRMKSVVKLQRELKEAEAVESKEKKTKLVTYARSHLCMSYILSHSKLTVSSWYSPLIFTS